MNPMGRPRSIEIRGDIVRRPLKPWSVTVQTLLAHLHGKGLPVPEPLGFDGDAEFVRLVPGDAGVDAWRHQTTLHGVASAGSLLRRVHDATREWEPPTDAIWAASEAGGPVICHGDPQPANFAWRAGSAVGLFDWDDARPAEAISDVAYALEWLTPFETDPDELARRGFGDDLDRRARIDAFLDGYRWDGPISVVDEVLHRQRRAIDEVVHQGEAGHEPAATWVAEGRPERWRASKLRVTESLRAAVE
jgi:hypothetical protein